MEMCRILAKARWWTLGIALTAVVVSSCTKEKSVEAQPKNYVGLGVELTMEAAGARVVRTLPHSPAEQARLEAGDILLEVDGVTLRGVTLLEAVKQLRGPPNTTIRILVRTKEGNREYSVTRRPVLNR
jgi:C-terminal processing protease CtpA/Prc